MDPFQLIRRGPQDECLRVLRELSDVNLTNEHGQSLLQEAIAYSNPEAAELLLERGINVNAPDAQGQTALHLLAVYPSVDLARMVLERGGSLDVSDSHGNQPLWTASFNGFQQGNYQLVELYLKHGADPHHVNNVGKSPRDLALSRQDTDIRLLELLEAVN